MSNPVAGWPWFAESLTDLAQPILPGRLYIVLAPTGTGKTLLTLNIVDGLLIATDTRMLVAATEETPRYLDLLAARAAGVSYADWVYGRLDPQQRASVARWRRAYSEEPRLRLLPQRSPSLQQLIDAIREHGVPDILVLDHLHALDRAGQNLPQSLETAIAVLGALASECDLAVIACAQVHRPQTRDPLYAYRIPTTSSALGCSLIEQHCDVLLGLSRKLRDDVSREVLLRLSRGLLHRGESVRDYEEPSLARITCLKHRLDDDQARRSILLRVRGGYLYDRLTLTSASGNA